MERKVDANMFRACKLMLAGGATVEEVGDYMQLGRSTVSRIKKSETLDEYRNATTAARLAIKAKQEKAKEPEPEPQPQVVEHKQTIMMQTSFYVSQKMDKLVELLTLIDRKMTMIAEELGCMKDEKDKEEKQDGR